ncbi:MAG: NPCBM/NEW2 domain-containing protein, partial [Anaerolineae bacterium]|nr:NPCBM/NEW2 domain-containing protein [Anaerolineae bacterium]
WKDAQVKLQAGWHALRIDYLDHGGSYWFEARWAPPGRSPGPIPSRLLSWTEEDLARALAPVQAPPPVLRVLGDAGNVVDTVPIAQARLQDPTWSWPVGDASFQGWPMTLGTRMFDHGIGLYGPGEVDFLLDRRFQRFQGMVGVDAHTYGDAHTRVQILGDGRVLWNSGVIHPWDPPAPFDVDVTGVRTLTLKQVEAGLFEGRGDGVDWVNPVLR